MVVGGGGQGDGDDNQDLQHDILFIKISSENPGHHDSKTIRLVLF